MGNQKGWNNIAVYNGIKYINCSIDIDKSSVYYDFKCLLYLNSNNRINKQLIFWNNNCAVNWVNYEYIINCEITLICG